MMARIKHLTYLALSITATKRPFSPGNKRSNICIPLLEQLVKEINETSKIYVPRAV